MSGSIGDLIAQLLAVRDRLDSAAITTKRAQADAEQALTHLITASQGSTDRSLTAAVTDARTAGEKAGRYARLLSEAAEHLSRYIEIIAPGASRAKPSADDTMPSGERLVSEAEAQSSKAESFLRRHVKKADDTESTLQQGEQTATAGLKDLFQAFKKDVGPTGNTTSTPSSNPATPVDRPQLEHPVTSVIMAAGAVVVGLRGLWNIAKKRRERNKNDDQPRDGRLHPHDDQRRAREERPDRGSP